MSTEERLETASEYLEAMQNSMPRTGFVDANDSRSCKLFTELIAICRSQQEEIEGLRGSLMSNLKWE